ncbi:MAG: helix-turn-helix domain-containing protein [Lachnospiraceae bacterium]|nr:helix-turn-helix domain-containing protein [Lachnospiraceae bacterium]
MQDTGKYYVINHLLMFTGLSDRTIRNYIASGILQGEKINGLWHFTPEQVEEFVSHPAVRPGILAKNNGLVYDFLLDHKKLKQEMCVILDIPYMDKKTVAEFFCNNINNGDYNNIKFSFDGVMETSRVILKGNAVEVLQLINEYNSKFPTSN